MKSSSQLGLGEAKLLAALHEQIRE